MRAHRAGRQAQIQLHLANKGRVGSGGDGLRGLLNTFSNTTAQEGALCLTGIVASGGCDHSRWLVRPIRLTRSKPTGKRFASTIRRPRICTDAGISVRLCVCVNARDR